MLPTCSQICTLCCSDGNKLSMHSFRLHLQFWHPLNIHANCGCPPPPCGLLSRNADSGKHASKHMPLLLAEAYKRVSHATCLSASQTHAAMTDTSCRRCKAPFLNTSGSGANCAARQSASSEASMASCCKLLRSTYIIGGSTALSCCVHDHNH